MMKKWFCLLLLSSPLMAQEGHEYLKNPAFNPKKVPAINEPALAPNSSWQAASAPNCAKAGTWTVQAPYKVTVTAFKDKKVPVAGVFERVRGEIHTDAANTVLKEVTGQIDLTSYNSTVPDRDRRVQRYVLGAEKNPEAKFTAKFSPNTKLPKEGSITSTLDAKLNFHDNQFAMKIPVKIERKNATTLQIVSTAPAELVFVKDSIRPSVMKLLEMCNHELLSPAVNITLDLTLMDSCQKK